MRRHGGEIVGIMIHVVPFAHLRRAALPTTIMGDDAIAVLEKEEHLRIPVIGRQRPAVTEDDGQTFAPILIKNLYPVFGFDDAHVLDSSVKRLGANSCLDTLVDELGEKGRVDHELAPLGGVSGGWLGGDSLWQRPARLLKCS